MNMTEFSKANLLRCESKEGFNHDLHSWTSPLDEVANVINRHRDNLSQDLRRYGIEQGFIT